MPKIKLGPLSALKFQVHLLLSWDHRGQSKRPAASRAEPELKQVSEGCQHQNGGVPRFLCFLQLYYLHTLACVLDRRVDSVERQLLFQVLCTDTLGVKDNGFSEQIKYKLDQIWKTQQCPQDWKCQFSFQSQRKAMLKNVQITKQLHSFHMLAK